MSCAQSSRSRFLLFCLTASLACLGLLKAQESGSVAVLDLEGRGISQVEAASLSDRLRAAIVRTGGVTVVERGQMERILSEQDFQLTGCTSDECAVEVGQLLGVTTIVAGSIGRVGSTYSVDIRTIDVQSGQITHSLWRDYRGEIDGLLAIMPEIAAELVSVTGAAAPPPLAPASIAITSQPPGARVVLDGEDAGTTPIAAAELEPDRSHSASLSLDGYQQVDTTIFAAAGRLYELDIPLKLLPSLLTISSNPPGANVIIDSKKAGSTPLERAELGPNQTHTVSLSLSGYQPVDTALFTEAGQFYELSLPLLRLHSQLTILSSPPGALVFLDNRGLRVTPLRVPEVTPDRQHRVSLRLNGYQQADTTFFAIAGEHHRMNIALQPVAVAETAVKPPVVPPPEAQRPPPAVKPKKGGGGGLLVLVLLAATGYYGYTEGWFDEWLKPPPEEELRVGNPPSVPSP
ncbi:MAG: PEGA domain-containing protein [Candidatus Neomarinimicrobiota bacterium]